ncbi:hypothetical protein MAPG_09792 [Magnaporthiopsis poae ATCC 64411]|uniref:Uncharacterized protein n=1 Tax=Magnaporthiopsis poae (strain ATCC 64411 / 73-15) TaxID=644358 RepID=A0A0C4EAV8_MAGP6|nr:hypothetical protein MAPG_09792 [Magnaporthiopsis poae ATCC 64411]
MPCGRPAESTTNGGVTGRTMARRIPATSRLSLGSRPPAEAADALNRHLWGRPTESGHSNLVSWATSLLFALRFAFYRQPRDGTPLEDIKLCIINTKLFPAGVFVRDLPQTLTSLSRRRNEDYRRNGDYFGEFLSQGALHLDGKSCIVSLADLVDRGLLRPHPALDRDHEHHRWANWVKQERCRWSDPTWAFSRPDEPVVPAELFSLVSLFKPGFYLPVAAALSSLQPRDPSNHHLLESLDLALARDADDATLKHYYNPCNPFLTSNQHAADKRMPEVDQANTLIRNLAILREEKKKVLPLSTVPATGSPQGGGQVGAESTEGSIVAWQAWLHALPKLLPAAGMPAW